MFILNKASGMIQEMSNNDVIKACKADPNHYAVANTREELLGETPAEGTELPQNDQEEDAGEELPMNPPENDSEGSEDAQEDESEAVESVDYSKMTVEELRKIAKDKGIQGYGNMNKGTLVEVIKAHE